MDNNIITFQNSEIRENILNNKLEIFEIKQLAELENKYKNECKMALDFYRSWRRQYQEETDIIELFYMQLKGVALRRHAQATATAYLIIRQDFRIAFQRYINNNAKIRCNHNV